MPNNNQIILKNKQKRTIQKNSNNKSLVNILIFDSNEIYILELIYFISLLKLEMNSLNINIFYRKMIKLEDLIVSENDDIFNILILNLKMDLYKFEDTEIIAIKRYIEKFKKKPSIILLVNSTSQKWNTIYSNLMTQADYYIQHPLSYFGEGTNLRDIILIILKQQNILNSDYNISEDEISSIYASIKQYHEVLITNDEFQFKNSNK